ncbi:hypothetical protein SDC9_07451 [bioreactor metagenome]|uniref:Uncharacterized protein n=1 Tax=bioreactor metagenome TaxID=1076179 RepID=A0A644T6Q9_9ZZZZ|nr:hypothetical protein [Methanobrevibacter sp.]MEA4956907.1 hypothetical protein [Methanobrevibacter sp.]
MKINKVIELLKKVQEKHGDINVYASKDGSEGYVYAVNYDKDEDEAKIWVD